MSHVLKDAKVFMGAYNLTGYTNNVALQHGVEALDDTTLGSDTRTNTAGLKIVSAGVDGFWDSTPDAGLEGNVGVSDTAFSVVTPDGTAGSVAYFFKCVQGTYNVGGEVGTLLNFSAEANARANLIRGKLVYHDTVTATGTSTPISFPTMAAGETLWGALHVFSASTGDTLDVTVESDTATGFGTPVTQLTFTQVGAVPTAEWQSATGAISDSYMRVNYTPGGASPSYTFAVVLGID